MIKNADYESWNALAMADHIRYRNGPHRNRRLGELDPRKRVAWTTGFPVERPREAH